ncbi:MAG: isoprenyl transferase [Oscillospiraceae bacterium]|nr:isoprenyl transferase [Oscillospiraceae bacterium]MBP1554387.1 isoprenyl transferase [Oscillospiraceae bacterium]MBP1570711.1 isoprenyl transferase [Oscillospiraceae bacterium]
MENNITIPKHIGIIMDGNGRWAKKRMLPRNMGHKKGAEVFQDITRYCNQLGLEAVTFYAFSTENWKRPQEEIDGLMKLFKQYLIDAFDYEKENNKVVFLGDKSAFNQELRDLMLEIEQKTADRTGMILNLALNYGSRSEIVNACKEIAAKVKDGEISVDDIDEQMFSEHLYTKNQPDPDFILRPSGEKRISNFLLWQCAYSEFVYMDVLWPDFTRKDLDAAIEEFNRRNRRFGGV